MFENDCRATSSAALGDLLLRNAHERCGRPLKRSHNRNISAVNATTVIFHGGLIIQMRCRLKMRRTAPRSSATSFVGHPPQRNRCKGRLVARFA
ncbi:hypothetical protein EVAR_45986_1 [Eumeta japonica]|uniref:Uncharacterized protein n=1 Tax=Eumeta variegata TaxID=151549 RepID=A0A4C1X749_EUMVA|nr:hypothetical protein EVAR_45986_1 [Eumeta japonica]